MASLNKVLIMGNLTRDPELRYIPSGTAVCEFGLALNREYKDKAGEKREDVCFVDIVVWGRQGETCNQYLSKGRPVFIEGRLQFDSWESKEGEKRSRLRVVADRVQFMGSGRRDDSGGGGGPERGASQEKVGARSGGRGSAPPQDSGAGEPDDLNLDDIPF